jgi:hypothetical protein
MPFSKPSYPFPDGFPLPPDVPFIFHLQPGFFPSLLLLYIIPPARHDNGGSPVTYLLYASNPVPNPELLSLCMMTDVSAGIRLKERKEPTIFKSKLVMIISTNRIQQNGICSDNDTRSDSLLHYSVSLSLLKPALAMTLSPPFTTHPLTSLRPTL